MPTRGDADDDQDHGHGGRLCERRRVPTVRFDQHWLPLAALFAASRGPARAVGFKAYRIGNQAYLVRAPTRGRTGRPGRRVPGLSDRLDRSLTSKSSPNNERYRARSTHACGAAGHAASAADRPVVPGRHWRRFVRDVTRFDNSLTYVAPHVYHSEYSETEK